MKLEDTEDLDLGGLTQREKKQFVNKLQEAIQVDHVKSFFIFHFHFHSDFKRQLISI